MKQNKFCAVIPAAGAGSRLGFDVPKILVEFKKGIKTIDLLYRSLHKHVDKIIIIVSPYTKILIEKEISLKNFNINGVTVETVVQNKPTGMGEAIFEAYSIWKNFDNIIIVWGDQASLAEQTVKETTRQQSGNIERCLTIPVVMKNDLYVEYFFENDKLKKILQTREGDQVNNYGYSDVAVFAISTDSLKNHWDNFRKITMQGSITGEINFLPFLKYLSDEGWKVNKFCVSDPVQSVGLNTKEDFEFLLNNLDFDFS